MKRLAGQAGRTLGYLLHHTGMVIITLFFVLAIGLGAFAYRLSLGPVQIPWMTSQLASAVSGQGINISISQAELAWGGYKSGGGVPLYLQLGDIVARNAAGVELVEIPTARLVFLPAALMGSRAPILVTSSNALFAGSKVTVSLAAAIRLGFLHFAQADMNFKLGAGALGSGDMSLPISGGGFNVTITPDAVILRNGTLSLARVDGNSPAISFSGQGARQGSWQGSVNVTADAVAADALDRYWPSGLAAQTRRWVVANITAGTAAQANFTFGLSAPASLTSLSLTSGSGHFRGDDLSVGWIPHAAPITKVSGEFTLDDLDTITITADTGELGGVALNAGHMKITGLSHPDQFADLTVPVNGTLANIIAVLNAAPLNLLQVAPPEILHATGAVSGTVLATFPLKEQLRLAQVNLNVTAHLTDGAAPTPLADLNFSDGTVDLTASTASLQAKGAATLDHQAAAFSVQAAFGSGQPEIRFALQTIAGKTLLGLLRLQGGDGSVNGNVPLTIVIDQKRSGQASATADADLTPAALKLPLFGWSKPAGAAGHARIAAMIINGGADALTAISAAAPGLDIAGAAVPGQPDVMRFSRLDIGGTQAAGEVAAAEHGRPWRLDLNGPVLDVSAMMNQAQASANGKPANTAPTGASGPLWQARLEFGRLVMAPDAPVLHGLVFNGNGQGRDIVSADASAADDDGSEINFRARRTDGADRLHLDTQDAGYLLRAMGVYQNLENGVAVLDADDTDPANITGVVKIENFRILHAPGAAKVLQGLTVYGVADATSGPGLVFDRLVAPFSLGPDELTLQGARAFSSSLGFTASGTINVNDGQADLDTTIVPAYFLNAALGKIPGIGKLFSAEKGGGLFAMRAKITGHLSDPDVAVNPLSALTPGVLRDVFGLGEGHTAAAP